MSGHYNHLPLQSPVEQLDAEHDHSDTEGKPTSTHAVENDLITFLL
jgi:hypothetical protein